jgi:hypothetical protein
VTRNSFDLNKFFFSVLFSSYNFVFPQKKPERRFFFHEIPAQKFCFLPPVNDGKKNRVYCTDKEK